jgi:YbbR domain-containing protein
MITFLRNNLAWMLLAVLLSVGLWLVVTLDQNPTESNWFPNVPVEVKNLPGAVLPRADVQPVRVQISAPHDAWTSGALSAEKIKAVVDASTAGPGVTELPLSVTIADPRAIVEAVDPPKAVVRLEPVKKREVPIKTRVNGAVPLGYEAREPNVNPQTVTISGPQGPVEQVAYVVAEVSLEGARSSISQPVSLLPRSVAGDPVDKVDVSPERAVVEIQVAQEIAYKTVPVVPQVVGTVSFGYQIVGVMVDPVTTTVAGDPRPLGDMSYLQTRPVDVSNAVGDVALNAEPLLPPGVTLTRSQSFLVRVLVSPVEGSKTIEVAPQIKGAGERQVSISPSAVQVTVSGPMPLLTQLKPQDIQVVVDVTGAATGTAKLQSAITVPSLIKLVGNEPRDIVVTIK